MTPDEYLKIQETNKKIYGLARNEEERNRFLAKMMEAEIKFIEENISPVEVNETIAGQLLNISMIPRTKEKSDLPAESDMLCVTCEKVTPENYLEKLSATDSNGNSVDLKQLLKDNPEAIQKICDAFNAALKSDLQKQFGNKDDLQMFEDDHQIGLKRTPESIKSPEIEMNNIMDRAHNFATSQPQQRLRKQHEDAPKLKLEDDVSQRLVK